MNRKTWGQNVSSNGENRFASLYEQHHRHVAAYCRRRADVDHVDDLIADVFLTVWRKIDETPDDDQVLPWLYRIAYLVLTNHWRSRRRKTKLESRMLALGLPAPASMQDQVVMREELREVLETASRLPRRDQEILRLSLWEHLSHQDIGTVLGITPNAAKQRLHRARRALVREHQRLNKEPSQTPRCSGRR